jgi:hypothetical protein
MGFRDSFLSGLQSLRIGVQAASYALESFSSDKPLVELIPESETLKAMERYAIVYALWFCPVANHLQFLKLRGPDQIRPGEQLLMNAFAVRDESEAHRWYGIFNPSESASRAPALRLIAVDGVLQKEEHYNVGPDSD